MTTNKPLFCLAMTVTFLVGCRQREDLDQLKAISEGFQTANSVIRENNESIIYQLQKRARDLRTGFYIAVWEPKAIRIKKDADGIAASIEELKKELLKQSDSLKKGKAPLIEQLLAADGAGYKLVNRLAAFKDSFPAIVLADDSINSSQRNYLKAYIHKLYTTAPLLRGYSDSLNEAQKKQYAKRWLEENFAGTLAGMAFVLLNKIENDLLSTTNMFMGFCLNETAVRICGWPFFSGVAVINSSYVKQGQPIEVTAGVGEFSYAMKPRITMNGKEIKLDDNATAVHRFTANGRPGKHSVTVKFEFTRPDGTSEYVSKELKYIIADEK